MAFINAGNTCINISAHCLSCLECLGTICNTLRQLPSKDIVEPLIRLLKDSKFACTLKLFLHKRPSIYDVHTKGLDSGGHVQMGSSSMWTSIQKIRACWHHPVFFPCKGDHVFLYQNFVFGQNKSWEFFVVQLIPSTHISWDPPTLEHDEIMQWLSCQRHMAIHKGRWSVSCGQGRGGQNQTFLWMS